MQRWMLITVSANFYTLFLFDTLGDSVGFQGAYWVLIVMPLMPLCMFSVYACYNTVTQTAAIELNNVSNINTTVATENIIRDSELQMVDMVNTPQPEVAIETNNSLIVNSTGDSETEIVSELHRK